MKKTVCLVAVLTLVALMATSLTSCNVSDYIDVSGIGGGIFGYDGLLGGSGSGILGGIGGGNSNDEFYADDFIYFPQNDGTYIVFGENMRYLNRIVIPETHNGRRVTGLVEGCFYGCRMYEVVIPGSIEYIGSNAFDGCYNLERITFEGTVEQAQNRFGEGWNYNGSKFVSVYCSDGTIGEPITDILETSFDTRYEYYNGEYVEVLVSTNHEHDSRSVYDITAQSTGYMTFEYMVSSERNYDRLCVYVNGEQVLDASGMYEYQSFSYRVYAGDSIRFVYSKDSSNSENEDCARIVNLSFGDRLSESEPMGSEPTDDPVEEYEYGFTENWVYHNGREVIEYKSDNYHVAGSTAVMDYVIDQSGYLEFDYLVSSEGGCDCLRVYINNEMILDASGMNEFNNYIGYVSYGDVVRFEYRKDGSVDGGDDYAYIRDIRVSGSIVTEAPDWYESEGTNYYPDYDYEEYEFDTSTVYHNGNYVTEYVSTNKGTPHSMSYYEFTVYYTGYLSFDYLVSSEEGCDCFRVYVNGSCVFSTSGVMYSFDYEEIYVNAYDTVKFEYYKDGSVDRGDDCVYIRDVRLPE